MPSSSVIRQQHQQRQQQQRKAHQIQRQLQHHNNDVRRGKRNNRWLIFVVSVTAIAVTISSVFKSISIRIVDNYNRGDDHQGRRQRIQNKQQLDNQTLLRLQRQRQRAVFYNIYVPSPVQRNSGSESMTNHINQTTSDVADVDVVDSALLIIKEQLNFIRTSDLLMDVPIYYTLIGNNDNYKLATVDSAVTTTPGTIDDEIQKMCRHSSNDNSLHHSLNCTRSRYVRQGSEMLTLQSMWEYCSSSYDDDRLVTYIHSKGSYHPSTLNDNFRIMAMTAVTSNECQSIPYQKQQQQNDSQPRRSCNVCTGRFTPFPHYHPTGNFFVASCKYVRELIPPIEFERRMEDLMNYVLMGKQNKHDDGDDDRNQVEKDAAVNIPKPTFQQYRNGYSIGTKRFANEHWVSSYLPTFDPCDVVPLPHYKIGYKNLPLAVQPFVDDDVENGPPVRNHQSTTKNLLQRNQQLWTPSLVAAPRFDLKTFMKGTTDRGSWFCGQARLFEYTQLYREYLKKKNRSTHSGGRNKTGNTTSTNHNTIDLALVPPTSFIWEYYYETFKGCPEPLNYTKHARLFMS